MKTFIVVLISLLAGLAVGGFLAVGFGANMGAASGFVFGSQAGICTAALTAEEGGMVKPGQLDALVAASVERLRRHAPKPPDDNKVEWVKDAATCRGIVERLDSSPTPGGPR